MVCGVWLGVNLRTDTKKTCERDWTACSKFVNLSRHGCKCNICLTRGDLYEHLIRDNEKDICISSGNHEGNGYGLRL